MYTLLLRISAPLQSWGSSSLFDTRETDDYPTKSGVIGMIAAGMGRKRGEPLDDLQKLRFGTRIDYQGKRVTDFQITQMGEKLNSNLSFRSYLSDALFLVGLETPDLEFLESVVHALKEPVYSLFLGRRSCPPSQPLVLEIVEKDLYSSLVQKEWLVPKWREKSILKSNTEYRLRIMTEEPSANTFVRDNPVSFSSYKREYAYRGIVEMDPKVIEQEQNQYSTRHDAMSELGG